MQTDTSDSLSRQKTLTFGGVKATALQLMPDSSWVIYGPDGEPIFSVGATASETEIADHLRITLKLWFRAALKELELV